MSHTVRQQGSIETLVAVGGMSAVQRDFSMSVASLRCKGAHHNEGDWSFLIIDRQYRARW